MHKDLSHDEARALARLQAEQGLPQPSATSGPRQVNTQERIIKAAVTAKGTFDEAKPAPKEAPMDRATRRALKRGGFKMPGNNRPNRKGAAIQQKQLTGMVTVGEERKLVEVATFVRGKGGKRKMVTKKMVLSRGMIATDPKLRERITGQVVRSAKDEEEDSIKNVEIQVLVPQNGRVKRIK